MAATNEMNERSPWILAIEPGPPAQVKEVDLNYSALKDKLLQPEQYRPKPHSAGPSEPPPKIVSLYRAFSTQKGLDWIISNARWAPIHMFDETLFREWARFQVEKIYPHNIEYQFRVQLTDLIRKHKTEYFELKYARKAAQSVYLEHPIAQEIAKAEKQIEGMQKKVANFEQILSGSSKKPIPADRLADFHARCAAAGLELSQAEQRLAVLKATEPALQFFQSSQRLHQFTVDTGIDRLLTLRKEQSKIAGNRAQSVGHAFEPVALRCFEKMYIPGFGPPPEGYTRHMLSNLKLGLSKNEIDGMCVLKKSGDESAEVIVEAIIECKKNPADVGFSFRGLSELIAFFKNDSEHYVLKDFTNRHYPKGVFVSKTHTQGSEQLPFLLTPASFERFTYNEAAGCYLDHIYFLIQQRMLQRLSSETERIFASRFYSDLEVYIDDIDSISSETIRALISGLSAKEEIDPLEIFKLFSTHDRAHQILMIVEGKISYDDYLIL